MTTAEQDLTLNKPAGIQGARQKRTTFSYVPDGNGKGEILQAIQPAATGGALTWTYEYTAGGQVLAATDPRNVRTEHHSTTRTTTPRRPPSTRRA